MGKLNTEKGRKRNMFNKSINKYNKLYEEVKKCVI